ncbi:P pilus assembly chaperone PapD [Pseudomonas sp. TE3786]
MTNEGEDPKLVQIWIDDGDRQASPDKIKVPFVVLTPIFRMDAKKGQVTRIQYTHNKDLPTDRESVFWLNVLEIPAKPSLKEKEENYLQFRYRTRIKLFFRPKGIVGTAVEAPDKLVFKYKPGYIQVENPTAFYLSISSLDVGKDAQGGKLESQMLEPFSKKMFELKGQTKAVLEPVIKFSAINDFGGAPVREKSAVAF